MSEYKRDKIGLHMNMVDVLVALAEGNIGAVQVLTQLCEAPTGFLDCFHLDDMNMRGPQIWVAYKDVCGSDIEVLRKKIKTRDAEMVAAVNKEMLMDPKWKEVAVAHGHSFERRP